MAESTVALIIMACIIISFAAQLIPLGITAVLGAIAMGAFGIISFEDAFSGFGSDTVMMVAGMIIVGNALAETGVADVIGKKIIGIRGIGSNEKVFLVWILVLSSVFHLFMNNTVTVAVFLHLIATVAKASEGRITKKNTFMALGITSVIGGNMTLVSSTPQVIAQGILVQTPGLRGLSFFELLPGALPLLAIVILYFVTIGYRLQKKVFNFPEVADEEAPQSPVPSEGKTAPKTTKMTLSVLVFLACVAGFAARVFTFGTVAVLGACICILTGCISFKRAFATMDWTAILVLGGALGFAKGVEESGAISLIADKLLDLVDGAASPPMILLIILVLATTAISMVTSNTATAAIFTPLAISLAQKVGANPIAFVIAIIYASNFDFATPIGTPPITMTLCGGYRFNDYIKVGGLLNLIVVVATILLVPLIYGL